MDSDTAVGVSIGVFVLVALTVLIGAGMWGCPQYNVYQQRLEGEASLAKANYDRQIMVTEAQAKKNAAELLGEAEVTRAKYLAQANQIIGDSLKNKEEYLRYLWIQSIDKVTGQIIYVPTEANLPILEAGRFQMGRR